MRVLKNFNNISDELKATIPALKPGEVKVFQMLTGRNDVDSHTGEWSMQYPKVQIPARDRIWDPFKKEYVDIGVVETFKDNEPVTFKFLMPGVGPSKFSGKFSLNAGIAADVEWYEYLWLCNYNEENPNRDKSIEPLFKPIDYLAESKAKIGKRSALRDALNIVHDFTEAELRMIADSQNWEYITEPDILKSRVEDYAQENPETFATLWADPRTRTKSEAKRAANAEIIKLNLVKKQVLWGESDELIATLAFDHADKWLDSFADWLATHKNGRAVREKMQKLLKASVKEAAAEMA